MRGVRAVRAVLPFCAPKSEQMLQKIFPMLVQGVSLCQNSFERVGGGRNFAYAQIHFSIMRRERQGEACVRNIIRRQVRKYYHHYDNILQFIVQVMYSFLTGLLVRGLWVTHGELLLFQVLQVSAIPKYRTSVQDSPHLNKFV